MINISKMVTCYEDNETGDGMRIAEKGVVCDFKQMVQKGPGIQVSFCERP